MKNFEQKLTGGHPNSLGNTLSVVEEVLSDHDTFDELFNCYFSADEVVRLRVSNAMKRVCKVEPQLVFAYMDRFISEISKIDQASTQWTLAQLFSWLKGHMSALQKEEALAIMQENLAHHHDWIVLNTTMDTLSTWDSDNEVLLSWMKPHLDRLSQDTRKSVAKKAHKTISALY